MLLFYLPLVMFDTALAAVEASLCMWDTQMPRSKANKPTIILLQ